MQPRIKQPVFILSGTQQALLSIHKTTLESGIPKSTFELVNLRASQINGCGVCVDMHSRALRKLGENPERIFCVGGWREAPYYSDAERAALALAEAGSRIADRADAVSEDVWNEAAKHYNETQLGALVMSIGMINLWNRLNVLTRQMGGEFLEQYI
jgi:AhpD family alkylhydroperoxidase